MALIALGLAVIASVVGALAGLRLPAGWRWLEGVIPVLAATATLASLAARLPLQNVLACGLVLFFTSGMVMAVAAYTGTPLGKFEFDRDLGPRLLGFVAWPTPFLWLAVLLSARQCAKVILRPWRRIRSYGWLLLSVALGLSLVLALPLEPFGRQVLGWWKWPHPEAGGSWLGAPPAFPLTVVLLATALLMLVTPWLITKRPTGQAADYGPVLVWLALDLWATVGNVSVGLWLPAVIGLAGGAAAAILAWRGGKAVISSPAQPGALPVSAA